MFAALAFFKSVPGWIYAAVAVVIVCALILWGAYEQGYSAASTKYETQLAKARAKVAEANATAAQFNSTEVERLTAKNKELARTVQEVSNALRENPDAGDCGLDAFSLQQLNRIGGATETGNSVTNPHQ